MTSVYQYERGHADGSAHMRDLLGGKGANLAEMARLGLPVPPGFTIPTSVCAYFFQNGETYPPGLAADVMNALSRVEDILGRKLGDEERPLLLAVRSGARDSMPGMMDTILNLGLNDRTVEALALLSGNRRFAFDSYRRFIQMYGDVVLGLDRHRFETMIANAKKTRGVVEDSDLDAEALEELANNFKAYLEELGKPLPQDTHKQLWGAISAVFTSWANPRAVAYRRLNGIPDEWGTAVNVQSMVFGNLGPTSATGVAFTRNPSTGGEGLFGEFLVNAQGEDVVAGVRTPNPLRKDSGRPGDSLEEAMPDCWRELVAVGQRLEQHYRDMQDLEFTIEDGRLWMLQTRRGKRSAAAALSIATDLADKGIISREEALLRLSPSAVEQLLHPAIDPAIADRAIGRGLGASPGAASGRISFTSDEAVRLAKDGVDVILVRAETSPEDILGMNAARGILTLRGGLTSHAAVVARGMGRPCIVGAESLRIDADESGIAIGDKTYAAGDVLTIDGASGLIFEGAVPMTAATRPEALDRVLAWADGAARLKVRANADTPQDAAAAMENGAVGIGLCRTEHMFFAEGRIGPMREMILAENEESRRTALAKLLPFQRADFKDIFGAVRGRPVTIRLLDPPLHEFLPQADDFGRLADTLGTSREDVEWRVKRLAEVNPMLGFRGCRLAIAFPEIAAMQARAIFEAAIASAEETGITPQVEIMVPLVTRRAEFDAVQRVIDAAADAVRAETGADIPYQAGTMIELPSAALAAEDIATSAQFFSFGTNDLTQTSLGMSRDDAGRFLPIYIDKGLFANDPFVSIDRAGVGTLMRIAAIEGRKTRPDLKMGICGEHAADPSSVELCEELGLDYISCSPLRVAVARLAAAHAALRTKATPEV